MKNFLCVIVDRKTNETLAEYEIEVDEKEYLFGYPPFVRARFLAVKKFENATNMDSIKNDFYADSLEIS